MKSFKINTETRKVEVIELNSWEDIAPAIGNKCEIFAAPVTFENEDTIYVDDEGLFHPFQGGFMMKDWQTPIVGNAIVQGTNDEGESIEPLTTKEELESMIIWLDEERCARWANQFR